MRGKFRRSSPHSLWTIEAPAFQKVACGVLRKNATEKLRFAKNALKIQKSKRRWLKIAQTAKYELAKHFFFKQSAVEEKKKGTEAQQVVHWAREAFFGE